MKKTKKIYFLFITILVLAVLAMAMAVDVHVIYKNQLLTNYSRIIGNIIKEYPELESEIIHSILQNKGEEELGTTILTKYGLEDMDTIEYLKPIKNLKQRTILRFLGYLFLVIVVVGFWIYLYIRNTNKKITSINHYMNNILNEDYSLDIRDYEEGNLSNLKNDIYKLTVKLKTMSEQSNQDKVYLEEVLSDISHQLKTPLTSMYVINDLLENEQLNPELKKEFLNKNKNQLERIEWLVTSLLKISRLDSGMVILKKQEIKVEKLIQNTIESLRIPIELKNIELKIEIEKNITIIGDENWLVEALINIVKNAYEHTKEKGTIQIKATTNPLYTMIQIEDNGCGIKKEQLPHIFKRFYKGDANKESIGIGLNMAKKIIQRSNGTIQVESEESKYTHFTIKFYKQEV